MINFFCLFVLRFFSLEKILPSQTKKQNDNDFNIESKKLNFAIRNEYHQIYFTQEKIHNFYIYNVCMYKEEMKIEEKQTKQNISFEQCSCK